MKINATHKSVQHFLTKYEILSMLHHPNIVKTFGIFLSDETNPPSILLEFCPQSLEEVITKKMLNNVQLVFSIYQIVEGMKYVHFNHIIHRDIKPTNILIGSDGSIKISDFGISKLMTAEEQSMTCGAGTQKSMAPEVIDECSNYDEKVDVYSNRKSSSRIIFAWLTHFSVFISFPICPFFFKDNLLNFITFF